MLFIVNPRSGKEAVKTQIYDIIDTFTKGGYAVTVHITQAKLDACKYVAAHGEYYDLITVSGGDGTINEVTDGLMSISQEKRPSVGYIPSGSTNDFATTLGISKNMIQAADEIVNGSPYKCDIGKFQNDYFNYVAGFGAFTDVSYDTPQETKNVLGHFAYLLEGLKRLPAIKSYRMKVTSDEMVIEDDFVIGLVSNSTSIGGIKSSLKTNVELNDGLFEVVLFKMPTSLIELQDTVINYAKSNFECERFYVFKTAKVHFECEEEVRWTIDGEFGGAWKSVDIDIKKQAVEYILGNNE